MHIDAHIDSNPRLSSKIKVNTAELDLYIKVLALPLPLVDFESD